MNAAQYVEAQIYNGPYRLTDLPYEVEYLTGVKLSVRSLQRLLFTQLWWVGWRLDKYGRRVRQKKSFQQEELHWLVLWVNFREEVSRSLDDFLAFLVRAKNCGAQSAADYLQFLDLWREFRSQISYSSEDFLEFLQGCAENESQIHQCWQILRGYYGQRAA